MDLAPSVPAASRYKHQFPLLLFLLLLLEPALAVLLILVLKHLDIGIATDVKVKAGVGGSRQDVRDDILAFIFAVVLILVLGIVVITDEVEIAKVRSGPFKRDKVVLFVLALLRGTHKLGCRGIYFTYTTLQV